MREPDLKKPTRIPTRTFAAALSMCRDFKIVAPSFVTVMLRPRPVDCSILSLARNRLNVNKNNYLIRGEGVFVNTIPLGPRVDLTRSAIAIAPINDAYIKRTVDKISRF